MRNMNLVKISFGVIVGVILLILLVTITQGLLDKSEDKPCKGLGGVDGTCTLLTKCNYPGDFKKDQPPICSFRGKEPIICCPPASWGRPKRAGGRGSKLRKYCSSAEATCRKTWETYLESIKGKIDNEIIGGIRAPPMTHKHMALIGYGEEFPVYRGYWGCGGSLVTSRYVLSAAHCVTAGCGENCILRAKWVRFGDSDLASLFDNEFVQLRVIIETVSHPSYIIGGFYNDIALFKVDSEVLFTPGVAPVCIYTKEVISADVVTATGYGSVNSSDDPSDLLLEADLSLFDDFRCRNFFNRSKELPSGIDSKQMICAGTLDGSKDSCRGDSGGPLVLKTPEKCLKTQIGITSFGRKCGKKNNASPGVYTRVSAYVDWIERVVFAEESAEVPAESSRRDFEELQGVVGRRRASSSGDFQK